VPDARFMVVKGPHVGETKGKKGKGGTGTGSISSVGIREPPRQWSEGSAKGGKKRHAISILGAFSIVDGRREKGGRRKWGKRGKEANARVGFPSS